MDVVCGYVWQFFLCVDVDLNVWKMSSRPRQISKLDCGNCYLLSLPRIATHLSYLFTAVCTLPPIMGLFPVRIEPYSMFLPKLHQNPVWWCHQVWYPLLANLSLVKHLLFLNILSRFEVVLFWMGACLEIYGLLSLFLQARVHCLLTLCLTLSQAIA